MTDMTATIYLKDTTTLEDETAFATSVGLTVYEIALEPATAGWWFRVTGTPEAVQEYQRAQRSFSVMILDYDLTTT